jgi:hypothetical protein
MSGIMINRVQVALLPVQICGDDYPVCALEHQVPFLYAAGAVVF